MPTVRHARRSETPNRASSIDTAARLRFGGQRFPDAISRNMSLSNPASAGSLSGGRSHPRAPSAISRRRPSCRRTGRATDSTWTRQSRGGGTPHRVVDRREELVALGELADDLIRRVPPALVRSHVVTDSSCPETGQPSRTTTGPLQRAHLTSSRGACGDGGGSQ
jgi:hypothetical protein